MAFYLSDNQITLKNLADRIKNTDLVPSRTALLDGIEQKFDLFKKQNIYTLADLRKAIKNSKNIPGFSEKTGVDAEYLTLLRREVEGYFPKPSPLSHFNWMDSTKLEKLGKKFKDNKNFYESAETLQERSKLGQVLDIDLDFINQLFCLTDLTRIQWMSPTAARMVYAAGYTSTQAVADADAEILCDAVDRKNQQEKFFKGKIGLRDIKRLVQAAGYLTKID